MRAPRRPIASRRRVRDDAVSEVMGTTLLVALAVVFASAFGALILTSMMRDTGQPPTASFTMDATEGDPTVDVVMVSGASFDLGAARLVLLRNGGADTGSSSLVTPAVAGRWSPGERLRVTLSDGPVAAGDEFFFLAGHTETGKTIGSTRAKIEASVPAYRNNTLALTNGVLSPSPLTADGRSVSNLTVDLSASLGREFVRSVTANLSTLGGLAQAALVDDGTGGDAVAGDGVYTVQITAKNHSFTLQPTETVSIPVTATDINGRSVTLLASMTLSIPDQPLVTQGVTYFDIPSSATIERLWYADFAYRDTAALDNDQLALRVSDNVDPTKGWTAIVAFAPPASCSGAPGVTSVAMYRDGVAGNVTFTPAGGCFRLGAAAQLDLIRLNLSLDASASTVVWAASTASTPYNYTAAGIGADNQAAISFLGDSLTLSPLQTGLGTATLSWKTVTPNVAPTAFFTVTQAPNAPPYMRVDVDGTGSTDSDGVIASYVWSWGDGTTNGTGGTATHTYAAAGTYSLNLTVADDDGATANFSRTVTANSPPVITSVTNTTVGRTVDIFTQAGDPNGQTLTYAVAWGDGTTTGGLSGNVSRLYLTTGTFTVTVYANDSMGATASATHQVRPDLAPVIASITNVTTQLQVALTVAAGDPDGQSVTYAVAWGDGTVQTGATANLTYAFAAAGNYTITVYANDTFGVSTSSTHRAQVTLTPIISSFTVAGNNRTAILNASATAGGDSGETINYRVEWGDGTGADSATALASLTRTYTTSGTYTVTLYVNDSMGGKTSQQTTVLANLAPTFTSGPTASSTDLNVTITSTTTDAEGDAITLTHVWGDGTTSSGNTRQYALPGNFTVLVYANDSNGRSTVRSVVATTTQTIYAAAVDTDVASPGGTFAGLVNLSRDNAGDLASLTEGATVALAFYPPSTNDRDFNTSIGNWNVTAASNVAVTREATGGNPGGVLRMRSTSGTWSGTVEVSFTLATAASSSATFTVDSYTTGGGTLTFQLVKPDASVVTLGTNSAGVYTTTTATVAQSDLSTTGTYKIRIPITGSGNNKDTFIDNVALSISSADNHRAQKQLSLSPVPTAAGMNHYLEVRAAQASGTTETLEVQVFNGATWVTKANVTSTTLTTYVILLSSSEWSGGTVQVRLVDATTSSDLTQSAWTIDYVRDVVRAP